MGIIVSKEEHIRKHPVKGDADAFYFACRTGDLDYVRRILPTMTWQQLNQIQHNGSTYLHVASYTGRTEIVRLLLQHGCLRSKLNSYGLTPYDEALTEDVKALFHRPRDERGVCRFIDDGINETFQLTSTPVASKDSQTTIITLNEDNEETPELDGSDDFIRNEWIESFNNFDKHSALVLSTTLRSNLFHRLFGLKRLALHTLMDYVISMSLTERDLENEDIQYLLQKYKTSRKITWLLSLYTHQSSFYSALRDDSKCSAFTMLLYRNLSQLRPRFYKGQTYRGMRLTKKELSAYWSLSKHRGFALMNKVFQSSSKCQNVAEGFFNPPDVPSDSDERIYMVLIQYDFLETCKSAIDLAPTKDTNLSEYGYEAEVIILPYTLFEICEMKYDETTKTAKICLKHIVPGGIFAGFRSAIKEFTTMSPEDIHQTFRRIEAMILAHRASK
ncbi:unnamed protein product [Didymodactylos carnosus]|uniref:Uncharacterized protein n=1 Tax=Didymodactylos carnosus TaxID=1234261 RepID=A0A816B3S8_9BILA|nr:unnamed protein product [Didymodactylos carnosus]CAF4484601.1 unnamed protein product [Didymodactylos carnosus]